MDSCKRGTPPDHLGQNTKLDDIPRRYVAAVLKAGGENRGGFGASDAEVVKLAEVGPGHVDVLLEFLLYGGLRNDDIYLLEAIKALARDQHKEFILSALPKVWALVDVVQAREWTEEAAPTLLDVLANRRKWTRRSLPTKWLDAVAELKRPETYKDLKGYFHHGINRYWTCVGAALGRSPHR